LIELEEEIELDFGEIKSIELEEKLVYCFECLKKFPKKLLSRQTEWNYKGFPTSTAVFVCSGCLEKYGLTKGKV